MSLFQSTLPTRGSDDRVLEHDSNDLNFNPRSPRGGATAVARHGKRLQILFQSTLPTRGSDYCDTCGAKMNKEFQSTLPTRGSDLLCALLPSSRPISIHAPHEGERHCRRPSATKIAGGISIHAPHEGERHSPSALPTTPHRIKFQSTLPTRGSDRAASIYRFLQHHFNPRSPRGGATLDPDWPGWDDVFQSTLPTRGSDPMAHMMR